jgi:NIMA (never in mitosis gene a)-related kinase
LYRKIKENKLVIIKDINMLELSASERTMALNEIRILALLDHPNIIRSMPILFISTFT